MTICRSASQKDTHCSMRKKVTAVRKMSQVRAVEKSLQHGTDASRFVMGVSFALPSSGRHGLAHAPSAYLTYSTLRAHGFIVMRPSTFHRAYVRSSAVAGVLAHSHRASSKRRAEEAADSPGVAVCAGEDGATEHSGRPLASDLLYYTSAPLPAPLGKKQRRGAPKPVPRNAEADARIDAELTRLKEMQGWLGHTVTDAPFVASSANHSSSQLPAPVAVPSSHSTSSLHAILGAPCDFFYAWLPVGASSTLLAESGVKPRAFKKTEPTIPDYICVCTK